jgi:UDP-glucose:tetrahydrobiopterin glucosyltransferase
MAKLSLLFLSTPVGPLGSGLGGGVELSLFNLTQEMGRRGHQVQVLAPVGSTMEPLPIVQIPGELQILAQSQGRDAPTVLPQNSVLENMWEYARQVQHQFDLLVNFAYDWLPFYLTPFFQRPIAHLVSMGSLTDAIDHMIGKVAEQFPKTIGVYTQYQAVTFPFADRCRILQSGLDFSVYDFCDTPEKVLGWVGRIAPEKGLGDAIAAAYQANLPLKIWGAMPDPDYWHHIRSTCPDAEIHYAGFLPTQELQQGLRTCYGLLMTPHWIEAFGNVAIEALACGVPVIAYRRGGPAEIVQDGITGWLVEPDSVTGLVEAIARLDQIDRSTCRQHAELKYSLSALGERFEQWLFDILDVAK